jgi:hypothetical protein
VENQGKSFKNLLSDLIGGKTDSDPFPPEMIEYLRRKLRKELEKSFPGMALSKQKEDREQPVQVRLLGGFLRACKDPECPDSSRE